MLACIDATPQAVFDVRDLSRKFDVKIEVAELKYGSWQGNAIFSIFKKGANIPFQIIRLKDTSVVVDSNGKPTFTTVSAKSDGKWSSLYFEDFNFDGVEDLAVPDGRNGGYGGTSYRIYLWSKKSQKFRFSKSMSRLAQGPYIGIPEAYKKGRTLTVGSKSGCCMHFKETYRVFNGKPKLIQDVSVYSGIVPDPNYEVTVTRKMVNGRWRTWEKKSRINGQ